MTSNQVGYLPQFYVSKYRIILKYEHNHFYAKKDDI